MLITETKKIKMSKIDTIFKQRMTRREFLAIIGLGILTIIGFTSLMGALTPKQHVSNATSSDYGSGSYGS